jgi:ribosomal protein S18 acetylase RimI-like enzyme
LISYKRIDCDYFEEYDSIPMQVYVKSQYVLERIDNGLGGILLKEVPVKSYIRDFSKHAKATRFSEKFDIKNWVFFMAFDDEKPIGAVTIVSRTEGIHMLDGRDDMTVLWDIRVADTYKHQGIGQKLFDLAAEWSRNNRFKQMKIECQNNNVPACKFYQKQGAILRKIDEYAYIDDDDSKDADSKFEIQFIWYLDL